MAQPRTEFDWTIYANATLAGLSALIPIPFLDWVFERFFQQRMLPAIIHRRKRDIPTIVVEKMNSREKEGRGCLDACLTLPWKAAVILVKRLSRKIVYFLAIQEATDKLSYYWHEAFLLDYMLAAGYLDDEESAGVAKAVMLRLLTEEATTSPLRQLARQLTASTRHVFRSLIGARRGEEDSVIEQKKLQMIEHWDNFSGYFEQLAARYDQAYQRQQTMGPTQPGNSENPGH